jgi:hypothetical protein
MQPLGQFHSVEEAKTAAVLDSTTTSTPNYAFDFSVIDPAGTAVSPTVWTSNGQQRFGFVPQAITPGSTFLLGVTFLLTVDVFNGAALTAGSFAEVPSAAPKCLAAIAKDTFDQIRVPTSDCESTMPKCPIWDV